MKRNSKLYVDLKNFKFYVNQKINFKLKFTKLADNLFQSYSVMTNENSFPELSTSMLKWVEQACTSQVIMQKKNKPTILYFKFGFIFQNLKSVIKLTLMQFQKQQ